MLLHTPQMLSPLAETVPHKSTALRARKMSTSGNRSWSEEEEHYLLQTRTQKMPYKHIAAHLRKTELACRLHYHQLAHGSNRRKRTASVSSTATVASNSTAVSGPYGMLVDGDEYAPSSRHGSPISYSGNSPHLRAASLAGVSPGRSHKMLLPKPRTLTPRASPEPAVSASMGLRINTTNIAPAAPKPVDTGRLRAIYEARRQQFWAMVAADYGADVSPAQLEEIWRTSATTVRPPTPDPSPDGSILTNPVSLKPSCAYTSPVGGSPDYSRNCYSFNNTVTALSTPDRLTYAPKMSAPSNLAPAPPAAALPAAAPPAMGRQRSSTWSTATRENVPIASLLTEDKNPRGSDVA